MPRSLNASLIVLAPALSLLAGCGSSSVARRTTTTSSTRPPRRYRSGAAGRPRRRRAPDARRSSRAPAAGPSSSWPRRSGPADSSAPPPAASPPAPGVTRSPSTRALAASSTPPRRSTSPRPRTARRRGRSSHPPTRSGCRRPTAARRTPGPGGIAAIYAAHVPLPRPGTELVLALTRTPSGLTGAKGEIAVAARSPIPDVGQPAPRVATDTLASVERQPRRCSPPAIPPEQMASSLAHRGARQAPGRAAVLDAAAVRLADLRPGHRHRRLSPAPVRQSHHVHPSGGLRGQPAFEGPAPGSSRRSGSRPSRGCSRSTATAGSPRGSRVPSAWARSPRRYRRRCDEARGRCRCIATSVPSRALAGCGSGSGAGVSVPTVGAARVFSLAGFTPAGDQPPARPTTISFTVQQPDGKPLTRYRTGAGPHTGVHLIIVRDDLAYIIHEHPPIGPDGLLRQRVTFPAPGPYRVLVDVYPDLPGGQPNFQLFRSIRVAGAYHPRPLPPFRAAQTDRRLPLRHAGPSGAARDPGPVRQRPGHRSRRPRRHLHPVVRRPRPRDLLPPGLAGLLPHPRLRRRRGQLHERARRRPGSPEPRPRRARSRSGCCSRCRERGSCSCR